ncbi:MAG TPA: PAS domain S-box protein, partial [Thermoplasmatales archaeon]|nr:PAS domain S-box protein [Thermoplasmatales archaeon]
MRAIPSIDEREHTDSDQDLILFLSLDKEIIQFNEESERLTGFSRDEMIHKKFIEIMVPAESIKQWKDLLDSIQHTICIENFVLPLKTKDDQIHTITWTGFLVKDENGIVKNICIFGKPLQTEAMSSQSSEIFTPKVASSGEG